MAYDDIDFGSIIGDRANLYETADGQRFMATDAEKPEAFDSLGLTRKREVAFKMDDGYTHVTTIEENVTPDDAWMRDNGATKIVEVRTPKNYVYRVNTYALPDGQMTTVREDQDEEFRDWVTKTYGAQPTLQTHARVNGVYVSGANDQINEVLRMAKEQEAGLTAEQLAAIGVTEEQANAGIEAMLASKDTLEERVKRMGEIGFAEAESHDRGYRKLGHEIDDEWDATKATLATGLDIGTGLLDIATLGIADVVRTPEVMIQVYGNPETGLQALKDRAWVNKQADLARMAVGDAEYDKLSGMSDEELHEYFKDLLLEQRKMEYLDSLRGRTTGANVGTTITGNRSAGTSVDTILGTVSALPGGGAIYAETNSQGAASVTILSGIIEGNEAAADGGAILVYNSHRYNTATVLEIRGGSITDNAAEGDGDAVWVGYTEKAVRLPEFVVSGTPMVDGDIRMHGNGIVGVQIEVAVGFEPAGPLQVSFPQKPAYVIATGDVEADDFAVEGYALTAGSDGLLVGTYDDDGSIVTVETTVGKDGSGNTVTTTVTKVDGVKTEVSIEAEAETAEVDISDAIADLDGALLRVTVGDITVEVDGGSFGDGKNVSLSIAVDPEGLSDAQTAVAEDALKVIDVSAVGAQLSGDATISVGFTLSGDYDADTIRVLCVSEDGATEAMQSAYSDGVVTFTTDHLSVFMIEADPVSEPVGPEEPDTPVVPDFPDIPVIPGGGDDGGVITPPITIVGGDSEGGMTTTETVIVAALGVLAAFVVVLMAYSLRKS